MPSNLEISRFYDLLVDVDDQMNKWEAWESETSSLEYQFTNGNSLLKNYAFILYFYLKIHWADGPRFSFLQTQQDLGSLIKHPS